MEHFYEKTEGENWFDYEDFYANIVKNANNKSHFVEIGTWKGKSACFMAVEIINSNKDIKFDCVDTWVVSSDTSWCVPHEINDDIFEIFKKNIEPVSSKINHIRSISWEAASLYDDNSLDFVFIDAAHDYLSVKKDIESWYDKVGQNGIISGHDYFNSPLGVKVAVDEFFLNKKTVEFYGSCWFVKK